MLNWIGCGNIGLITKNPFCARYALEPMAFLKHATSRSDMSIG